MEKKYQVFISSTYKDLIEARSKVRDAILSMMHFPVGMEMFNAADEEQWEIIQETIDSSDYYVLILGQRYGSVIESGSDAGISYTEKEFRYAREKKIPVLVFIIDDDVAIKPEFIEKDPESIKKLADFKTEAKKGRTVQWWTNIDELAREVSESLHQQMDRKKRPGWIRGDAFDIEASHAEILSLNKKIRELEQENAELKSQIVKRVPELMAAVVLDQQDDEEVDGKGLKTHGKLLIDSSDNAIKIQLYHNDGECYKNKYEPLDLSCVESHLKKYVKEKDLQAYNAALPSEEEINDYTDATVTIATSKSQVSAIRNQLGEEVGISVEPCRRDTSPAIALAAAYLKDVQGVGEEESVVVCPVDPYVENDYFEALKALGDRAAVSSANLVLMGIEPTYPSEKYGYIIPIGKEQVSKVSMFKEKPTQEVAKDYIAKGALWNGGVFAFKLGYVLNRAHELIDFVDYDDLFNKYDTLNKISFDYAVVEHEPEIEVMHFAGTWKDLGTWNTLTEAMDGHVVGEAMLNEKCENVHVVNELDVPILCMGLKDVVVSASPEGILVSDKEQSSYIKPFVNMLDHRVMFAEKSWGSFKVIDIDKESMSIKVTLNAGHRMNYHSHQHRDEVWTVIAGEGKTVVDGMEQNVKAGDVITMSAAV